MSAHHKRGRMAARMKKLLSVVGGRYATESWVLENLHRIVDAGEIICVENLTQAVKVEI